MKLSSFFCFFREKSGDLWSSESKTLVMNHSWVWHHPPSHFHFHKKVQVLLLLTISIKTSSHQHAHNTPSFPVRNLFWFIVSVRSQSSCVWVVVLVVSCGREQPQEVHPDWWPQRWLDSDSLHQAVGNGLPWYWMESSTTDTVIFISGLWEWKFRQGYRWNMVRSQVVVIQQRKKWNCDMMSLMLGIDAQPLRYFLHSFCLVNWWHTCQLIEKLINLRSLDIPLDVKMPFTFSRFVEKFCVYECVFLWIWWKIA